MENANENELRVAALCKRLGTLWSQSDEVVVNENILVATLKDCDLTVYGKLMSKPTVNFQAFWTTIKKAWKVDKVECALLEPGFFTFQFELGAEKTRILEEGPWCFSRDLLVLQQCEPDTPDHCYKFTHCDFWVQLKGIPRGRLTEEIIRNVASKIGPVIAVKIENRGNNPHKTGKARVRLDLATPLKSGTFLNLGYKKLWIDFRYERLPMFCFSCGCMGHYTTACEKIPYVAAEIEVNQQRKFGGWLRAEVNGSSPFWDMFYGNELPNFEEIDMEMERSPTAQANEDYNRVLTEIEGDCNLGEHSFSSSSGEGRRTLKPLLAITYPESSINVDNSLEAGETFACKGGAP